MPNDDKINPPHYDGDTCMRLIAEITSRMTGKEVFCIGAAIKYIYRARKKPGEPGADDCRKAVWYLDWLERQWEERKEAEQMEHEGWVVKQLRDIMNYAAPESWTEKLWCLR